MMVIAVAEWWIGEDRGVSMVGIVVVGLAGGGRKWRNGGKIGGNLWREEDRWPFFVAGKCKMWQRWREAHNGGKGWSEAKAREARMLRQKIRR